jgi:hypothetical protein
MRWQRTTVPKTTQSHASESSVPGEGMKPEQPGQTENNRHRSYAAKARCISRA